MIQIITTITQHGAHIHHETEISGPGDGMTTPLEIQLAKNVMQSTGKTLMDRAEPGTSNATEIIYDKPLKVWR